MEDGGAVCSWLLYVVGAELAQTYCVTGGMTGSLVGSLPLSEISTESERPCGDLLSVCLVSVWLQ